MTGQPAARRADARRNIEALLEAAASVFATSGVDAPAKQITDLAGVGVGTLYRHFPQRSDLVVAVLHREIDSCAGAATELAGTHEPEAALVAWLGHFTGFLATKNGLAQALRSGDPAYANLRGYFDERIEPALRPLLDTAVRTGAVRDDLDAAELLRAVALLCLPVGDEGPDARRRRVEVFVDGLRHPRG